jgi:DNA-binding transcriptional LysR family regulator
MINGSAEICLQKVEWTMGDYDLQSLRLFAAVVEEGNIARAAKKCHIAASAVSKRIADLEGRAKVALLYRLRDGVEPTTAGTALFKQVKQLLDMVGKLDAELSEYASGLQGRIRIWANTSAVTQFLPEDLKDFSDLYPDVRFDLKEDISARNIEAINNGSCDLAIFNEHVQHRGIQTRIYRRDTLQVVVPLQHELAHRESVTLAETLMFDQVGLQEGSSLQAKIQDEANTLSGNVRFRVQVLSFDGIRRMVEAGLGLAILPQGAIGPYTSNLAIKAIDLDEPWATRTLLVGFRSLETMALPCRRLVEHLAPVIAVQQPNAQQQS